MAKDISEYTDEELQEIGRKVVLRRQKVAERDTEKRAIVQRLYKEWKAGKIRLS